GPRAPGQRPFKIGRPQVAGLATLRTGALEEARERVVADRPADGRFHLVVGLADRLERELTRGEPVPAALRRLLELRRRPLVSLVVARRERRDERGIVDAAVPWGRVLGALALARRRLARARERRRIRRDRESADERVFGRDAHEHAGALEARIGGLLLPGER